MLDEQRARLWNDREAINDALRVQWQDIDDSTVEAIAGERDKLAVSLRNRYGLCRAEVERRIRAWENLLLARR